MRSWVRVAAAASIIAIAQLGQAAPPPELAPPAAENQQPAWLAAHIEASLARQPGLATARIAVLVKRVSDGRILYERDAHTPYNLASNTKVLTSVTALTVLGPSYRFTTSVHAKGPRISEGAIDALYLRGGGDPSLAEEDLQELARNLAARGVRSVRAIYWDDSMFDGADDPPHFDADPDEQASFRAPTSALSVNGNVARIEAIAGHRDTAAIEIHPPTLGAISVKSATVSVSATHRSAMLVWARPQPASKPLTTELEIRGTMNRSDGIISQRRRIELPAKVATECFVYFLRKQGIKAPAPTGRAAVPPNATLITSHASEPLAHMLAAVGKHSNNFVAEMIFKTAGAVATGTPMATWAQGQQTVMQLLRTLGLDTASMRVDNGSGLYNSSAVSAAQLVSVLEAGLRSFGMQPEFLASLAVGGKDGTLASRFVDAPAAGFVRAKTGTLDQVSTLAGFVGKDTLNLVTFAILINDMPVTSRVAARQLQEDIVNAVFALTP